MRLLRVDRTSVSTFGVGDLIAIVVFVSIGETFHSGAPWTVPGRVAETAVTFLVGWVLLSPILGAYRESNRESVRTAVGSAFLTWIGADVLAQGLRSTTVFHGDAATSFFVVAALFGGTLISIWRYLRVSLVRW